MNLPATPSPPSTLAPIRSVFLALFGLYVVLSIGFVIPRITGDGVAYYAQTRSLLLDGDLDLAGEYAIPVERYAPGGDPGPRAVVPRDAQGAFEHDANLGMAVLLGPFLVLGHLATALTGAISSALGAPVPPFSMDGFDTPLVLGVAFGANALVAAGLAILVAALRPIVGTGVAILAATLTWLGTALFYWSTQRPAHAHAPTVFLECLFVALFITRARNVRDPAAWLALGILLALLVTTRPLTIAYAVIPAAYLVLAIGRPAWRQWTMGSASIRTRVGAAARMAAPGRWPA